MGVLLGLIHDRCDRASKGVPDFRMSVSDLAHLLATGSYGCCFLAQPWPTSYCIVAVYSSAPGPRSSITADLIFRPIEPSSRCIVVLGCTECECDDASRMPSRAVIVWRVGLPSGGEVVTLFANPAISKRSHGPCQSERLITQQVEAVMMYAVVLVMSAMDKVVVVVVVVIFNVYFRLP